MGVIEVTSPGLFRLLRLVLDYKWNHWMRFRSAFVPKCQISIGQGFEGTETLFTIETATAIIKLLGQKRNPLGFFHVMKRENLTSWGEIATFLNQAADKRIDAIEYLASIRNLSRSTAQAIIDYGLEHKLLRFKS